MSFNATTKKPVRKRSTRSLHPPREGHAGGNGANLREVPRKVVHEKKYIEINYEKPVLQSGQGRKKSTVTHQLTLDANLLDVSLKGLGLFTTDEIRPGTKIRISFQDLNQPYLLIGQVIWCKKIPSTNVVFKVGVSMKWRIGVALMESENQEDLKKFRENLETF